MTTPMSEPAFDLESVYDAEIAPLMEQIIAVCKRAKLPMVATFCYAKGRNTDDLEGLEMATTLIPRDDWQAPEIEEAIKIIRGGASTRPKFAAFTMTQP